MPGWAAMSRVIGDVMQAASWRWCVAPIGVPAVAFVGSERFGSSSLPEANLSEGVDVLRSCGRHSAMARRMASHCLRVAAPSMR